MMLMPLVFVSLPHPLFLIVTRTSTTETDNLSVGWLWAVSYSTWLCCLYNCHWYSFWRLTLVGGFFCLLFFLALLPLQLSLIIFLRLTLVGGCFCLLFFLALLPLQLPLIIFLKVDSSWRMFLPLILLGFIASTTVTDNLS